ncbi:TauD/TfdA family dioxygenase [Streptomyces vinaceus]|uniref:TauD/TfdA family dioxygenase n=1 Tax=Streptomyces vinaceus TaxID=1960 RepID=UPI0036B5C240
MSRTTSGTTMTTSGTTMTTTAVRGSGEATLADLALPDAVRAAIGRELRDLPDPGADPDRATARCHQVFAQLPLELLRSVLDFGRHHDTPGVALVRNLPVDAETGPTPLDGGPGRGKSGFVSEGVLLGLSGLLGEPLGVLTEKAGRLIHDVVPVAGGERTQTNQSSAVFLNFHSDITYDATGRYDRANPDFLVLNCLRADPSGDAVTYYADARDICGQLPPGALELLRGPYFRLNAPGSYTRSVAGGAEVLSEPVPIISGGGAHPEITVSANGVRALNRDAAAAFERLQETCRAVAHAVRLEPGQALLVNNRKGVHARSPFGARHDGRDRWLQRTYVRRSLWDIRYRVTPQDRRVYF